MSQKGDWSMSDGLDVMNEGHVNGLNAETANGILEIGRAHV